MSTAPQTFRHAAVLVTARTVVAAAGTAFYAVMGAAAGTTLSLYFNLAARDVGYIDPGHAAFKVGADMALAGGVIGATYGFHKMGGFRFLKWGGQEIIRRISATPDIA
jgi:hypothetical protein